MKARGNANQRIIRTTTANATSRLQPKPAFISNSSQGKDVPDQQDNQQANEWLRPASLFWRKWGDRVVQELAAEMTRQAECEQETAQKAACSAGRGSIFSARSGRLPKYGPSSDTDSSDTDISMLSCSDVELAAENKSSPFLRRRKGKSKMESKTDSKSDETSDENKVIMNATTTTDDENSPTKSAPQSNWIKYATKTSGALDRLLQRDSSHLVPSTHELMSEEERELVRHTARFTTNLNRTKSASLQNVQQVSSLLHSF